MLFLIITVPGQNVIEKNPYHLMWISVHFVPLSMVLRSVFPRYSTEAAPGLVSNKSVFASIMPAMAAPTAPRPSDHMPIASVSPSRTDDDTAEKICMVGYMKHCFNNSNLWNPRCNFLFTINPSRQRIPFHPKSMFFYLTFVLKATL